MNTSVHGQFLDQKGQNDDRHLLQLAAREVHTAQLRHLMDVICRILGLAKKVIAATSILMGTRIRTWTKSTFVPITLVNSIRGTSIDAISGVLTGTVIQEPFDTPAYLGHLLY